MGQIKNIKLHIVTDIKVVEKKVPTQTKNVLLSLEVKEIKLSWM